jgi:uncharacterized protein (TIGR03086 family)
MSDATTNYRTAVDGFDAVIRAVPAERWEAQSPCEKWCTREVAGHVIGGLRMITALATTGAPPGQRPSDREIAGDDPVASWQRARESALAALTPEALDRIAPGPFGDMPVGAMLDQFMAGEVMVHTWDLARAAGLRVTLDAALVEDTFAKWEPLDKMMRRPGAFGPKLTAPESAARQEQLMAFLGRRV